MSVGRICQRVVDLAEAEETAAAAAARMFERNVGTLLVVNHLRVPVGLVTDRDLVVRVLAAEKPATTPVGEVMTPYPKVIEEHAPIETALIMMRDGGFRRLPVVDWEGRLVGILALDDVLQLLAEELHYIGALLERSSPPSLAEAAS